MTVDQATDLVREALLVMLIASAPVLGAAVVIGVTVSIIQALTQIQEQTLSFVPKIVGMGIIAVLLMPWITRLLMDYAHQMFSS